GLNAAVAVAVSSDGQNVYTVGQTDSAIGVFQRNTMTGQLTFLEAQQDGVGGVDGVGGARAVVVSPDGNNVYAAGAGDNAVAVFGRNTMTGGLTFTSLQRE